MSSKPNETSVEKEEASSLGEESAPKPEEKPLEEEPTQDQDEEQNGEVQNEGEKKEDTKLGKATLSLTIARLTGKQEDEGENDGPAVTSAPAAITTTSEVHQVQPPPPPAAATPSPPAASSSACSLPAPSPASSTAPAPSAGRASCAVAPAENTTTMSTTSPTSVTPSSTSTVPALVKPLSSLPPQMPMFPLSLQDKKSEDVCKSDHTLGQEHDHDKDKGSELFKAKEVTPSFPAALHSKTEGSENTAVAASTTAGPATPAAPPSLVTAGIKAGMPSIGSLAKKQSPLPSPPLKLQSKVGAAGPSFPAFIPRIIAPSTPGSFPKPSPLDNSSKSKTTAEVSRPEIPDIEAQSAALKSRFAEALKPKTTSPSKDSKSGVAIVKPKDSHSVGSFMKVSPVLDSKVLPGLMLESKKSGVEHQSHLPFHTTNSGSVQNVTVTKATTQLPSQTKTTENKSAVVTQSMATKDKSISPVQGQSTALTAASIVTSLSATSTLTTSTSTTVSRTGSMVFSKSVTTPIVTPVIRPLLSLNVRPPVGVASVPSLRFTSGTPVSLKNRGSSSTSPVTVRTPLGSQLHNSPVTTSSQNIVHTPIINQSGQSSSETIGLSSVLHVSPKSKTVLGSTVETSRTASHTFPAQSKVHIVSTGGNTSMAIHTLNQNSVAQPDSVHTIMASSASHSGTINRKSPVNHISGHGQAIVNVHNDSVTKVSVTTSIMIRDVTKKVEFSSSDSNKNSGAFVSSESNRPVPLKVDLLHAKVYQGASSTSSQIQSRGTQDLIHGVKHSSALPSQVSKIVHGPAQDAKKLQSPVSGLDIEKTVKVTHTVTNVSSVKSNVLISHPHPSVPRVSPTIVSTGVKPVGVANYSPPSLVQKKLPSPVKQPPVSVPVVNSHPGPVCASTGSSGPVGHRMLAGSHPVVATNSRSSHVTSATSNLDSGKATAAIQAVAARVKESHSAAVQAQHHTEVQHHQKRGISILKPLYDREFDLDDNDMEASTTTKPPPPPPMIPPSKSGTDPKILHNKSDLKSTVKETSPKQQKTDTAFSIAKILDHAKQAMEEEKRQKDTKPSLPVKDKSKALSKAVPPKQVRPTKSKPQVPTTVSEFPHNSTQHLSKFAQKSKQTPVLNSSVTTPSIMAPGFHLNLTESVQKVMQAIPSDNLSPPPCPPKVVRPGLFTKFAEEKAKMEAALNASSTQAKSTASSTVNSPAISSVPNTQSSVARSVSSVTSASEVLPTVTSTVVSSVTSSVSSSPVVSSAAPAVTVAVPAVRKIPTPPAALSTVVSGVNATVTQTTVKRTETVTVARSSTPPAARSDTPPAARGTNVSTVVTSKVNTAPLLAQGATATFLRKSPTPPSAATAHQAVFRKTGTPPVLSHTHQGTVKIPVSSTTMSQIINKITASVTLAASKSTTSTSFVTRNTPTPPMNRNTPTPPMSRNTPTPPMNRNTPTPPSGGTVVIHSRSPHSTPPAKIINVKDNLNPIKVDTHSTSGAPQTKTFQLQKVSPKETSKSGVKFEIMSQPHGASTIVVIKSDSKETLATPASDGTQTIILPQKDLIRKGMISSGSGTNAVSGSAGIVSVSSGQRVASAAAANISISHSSLSTVSASSASTGSSLISVNAFSRGGTVVVTKSGSAKPSVIGSSVITGNIISTKPSNTKTEMGKQTPPSVLVPLSNTGNTGSTSAEVIPKSPPTVTVVRPVAKTLSPGIQVLKSDNPVVSQATPNMPTQTPGISTPFTKVTIETKKAQNSESKPSPAETKPTPSLPSRTVPNTVPASLVSTVTVDTKPAGPSGIKSINIETSKPSLPSPISKEVLKSASQVSPKISPQVSPKVTTPQASPKMTAPPQQISPKSTAPQVSPKATLPVESKEVPAPLPTRRSARKRSTEKEREEIEQEHHPINNNKAEKAPSKRGEDEKIIKKTDAEQVQERKSRKPSGDSVSSEKSSRMRKPSGDLGSSERVSTRKGSADAAHQSVSPSPAAPPPAPAEETPAPRPARVTRRRSRESTESQQSTANSESSRSTRSTRRRGASESSDISVSSETNSELRSTPMSTRSSNDRSESPTTRPVRTSARNSARKRTSAEREEPSQALHTPAKLVVSDKERSVSPAPGRTGTRGSKRKLAMGEEHAADEVDAKKAKAEPDIAQKAKETGNPPSAAEGRSSRRTAAAKANDSKPASREPSPKPPTKTAAAKESSAAQTRGRGRPTKPAKAEEPEKPTGRAAAKQTKAEATEKHESSNTTTHVPAPTSTNKRAPSSAPRASTRSSTNKAAEVEKVQASEKRAPSPAVGTYN